eukprot:5178810-Pleurochrysis_carterae.AAC.3
MADEMTSAASYWEMQAVRGRCNARGIESGCEMRGRGGSGKQYACEGGAEQSMEERREGRLRRATAARRCPQTVTHTHASRRTIQFP